MPADAGIRSIEPGLRRWSASVSLRRLLLLMRFGMRRAEERRAIQDFLLKIFQVEVNHRSDVESDELRHDQPADDYQSKRPPRRAVGAITRGNRHCANHRCQRG